MTENADNKLRDVNEALILGSLRQHELTEAAESLNVKLREEIAERKKVEAALLKSEARFRVLFELGPMAIYACDATGAIREFNRRAVEMWGRAPDIANADERFCGAFKLYRPDGSFMPRDDCPMADVLSGKIAEARDVETVIERPDGSRIPSVLNILPLISPTGEITGAINCFADITERKQAEAHQQTLSKEIVHRSSNLLAIIQSIATRSLSEERTLAEGREVLIGRLHALARSQTALITKNFAGAALTEIVQLEFEGFSDQVKATGPGLMLNARVAQTFALVLHELATNATKHGALSRPEGLVAINWVMEGEGAAARVKFRWQESRGPPVVPPIRGGFGRTLIEKHVAIELRASPTITFASTGLIYEIDALLSDLSLNTE